MSIFESELHVIDEVPSLTCVNESYIIETVEAERISVDHVAHIKPSDGNSAATQLAAHLTGMHSAIKMLNSRIRVLYNHLISIQKGDAKYGHSLLRQISIKFSTETTSYRFSLVPRWLSHGVQRHIAHDLFGQNYQILQYHE